jgi:hypothetical protein
VLVFAATTPIRRSRHRICHDIPLDDRREGSRCADRRSFDDCGGLATEIRPASITGPVWTTRACGGDTGWLTDYPCRDPLSSI